jgi:phosphoribosylformylglycinamidine synthase
MKAAVVVFPGSNCDHDAYNVLNNVLDVDTSYVWHKDTELPKGTDLVMLPGGFSYGDYLRCGSIAQFSPIMASVISHANKGGYVMGICNGFQVLTETGLLPGTLMANQNLKFICRDVFLKAEGESSYTKDLENNLLRIPVAHGEGNFVIEDEGLKRLEDKGQIAFRYVDATGSLSEEANCNGSMDNIAGITNTAGNVLGMMPHPERYSESVLGGDDGKKIFQSLISNI